MVGEASMLFPGEGPFYEGSETVDGYYLGAGCGVLC